MSKKEDEFVGFALADGGSDKTDAEVEVLEVGERRGFWRRRGGEGEIGAGAADDVGRVLYWKGGARWS